jgi:hypothetical protein
MLSRDVRIFLSVGALKMANGGNNCSLTVHDLCIRTTLKSSELSLGVKSIFSVLPSIISVSTQYIERCFVFANNLREHSVMPRLKEIDPTYSN